jgi:hypothetical protein
MPTVKSINGTTWSVFKRLRSADRWMTVDDLHEEMSQDHVGRGGVFHRRIDISRENVYRSLCTLLKYGFVERDDPISGNGHVYHHSDVWAPGDPLPIPEGCDTFVWGDRYGRLLKDECLKNLEKFRPIRVTHARRPKVEIVLERDERTNMYKVRQHHIVYAAFLVPEDAMFYAQEFVRPRQGASPS